jgi:broad specificity phosphatase PhoE
MICCGATTATRDAAFPRDESLEDRARATAAAIAGGFRRHDRAFAAPAPAARETAAALGLDASPEPALRDCDYGRWSGRRLAEIADQEPEGLAIWLADAEAAPHGGEALNEVRRRVADWLDGLLRLDGHTIAVTHLAVIRAGLIHVLQAPPTTFWLIDLEPLSVIDLRSDSSRWRFRAGAIARQRSP